MMWKYFDVAECYKNCSEMKKNVLCDRYNPPKISIKIRNNLHKSNFLPKSKFFL